MHHEVETTMSALPPSIRDRPSSESLSARPDLIAGCRGELLRIAEFELDDRLRDKLDASDVVQATMLRGVKHYQDFRGQDRNALLAWLTEVMRNEVRAARRHYLAAQKRDVRREQPNCQSRLLIPAAREKSPSWHVVTSEARLHLVTAIVRLPEDYRLVLRLRTWQQLPFDEVGKRMNRSGDAAKKMWGRAVARLERELTEVESIG